jgi:hypothetical protein
MDVTEPRPEQWTAIDRLRYILDHWSDIFDVRISTSLNGIRGRGDAPPALLDMAHDPQVIKIESALADLARASSSHYQHLMAYHCNAEWREVRTMIPVQLTSGRWDKIPGWGRERIVPKWVSMAKVRYAEAFILAILHEEVFIPKPLWDGLTKPIGV